MKQNKGIAPVAILLILLGVLAVGGIVYYTGKNSVPKNEVVDNSNYTSPTTNNTTAQNSKQSDMGFYNGSKFSFSYPKEYTLTETIDGITITSIPVPKVDTGKCQQLEDEEARANCRNPQNKLSPNITITFKTGDANKLWETSLFGDSYPEEYKKSVYDQVKEISLGNPPQTYKYYYTGGEFGGYGKYGLFTSKGLLLAIYSHKDMEGGSQFSYMKSDEYQLDRHQQKQLLEQILATFTIKS